MKAYIKKLQSKEEGKRKQIFAFTMIGSMSIVSIIWIYSLGVRFSSPKIETQTNEDIKPFKLFSNSVSNAYNSISASVGKVPSIDKIKKQTQTQTTNTNTNTDTSVQDKQIDLIPVEYSN